MSIQQQKEFADTARKIQPLVLQNAARSRTQPENRALAERVGVLAVRQALQELLTVDA